MGKASYKHVTEQEFSIVKALQAAGVPVSMAAKASKRSHVVAQDIFLTESFEHYKSVVAERGRRNKEARAAKERLSQEAVEVATDFAAVDVLSQAVQRAKEENGILITTRNAFDSSEAFESLLKEASANDVAVTLVPSI